MISAPSTDLSPLDIHLFGFERVVIEGDAAALGKAFGFLRHRIGQPPGAAAGRGELQRQGHPVPGMDGAGYQGLHLFPFCNKGAAGFGGPQAHDQHQHSAGHKDHKVHALLLLLFEIQVLLYHICGAQSAANSSGKFVKKIWKFLLTFALLCYNS